MRALLFIAAAGAVVTAAFVPLAGPNNHASRERTRIWAQEPVSGGADEGGGVSAKGLDVGTSGHSRAARSVNGMSRRGVVGLAALLPLLVGDSSQQGVVQAATDELPWVPKGGVLDAILPESVLVESLPLNNQGIKGLGAALSYLNELRGPKGGFGRNDFCVGGNVEADLSYVTAADLDSNVTIPEAELSFFRWQKIKACVEDVKRIFEKERAGFPYALTIRANSTAESQLRRRTRFGLELKYLTDSINALYNATQREDVADTLKYQAESLLHLGHLGELMVAKFPFAPPRTDDRREDDYYNLPRLFGRAEVDITIKEVRRRGNGARSNGNNSTSPEEAPTRPLVGNMTIIVDGFNAPISAGNFVDLCQRGFYKGLPFRFDNITTDRGPLVDSEIVVGGTYRSGFVDPITGRPRRVPLEIMRAESQGNQPFYGQARNTGLFTRAAPLLSYRTPRAVGLLHPPEDGNAANSEFFLFTQDARCVKNARALDGKYTLVGYVIGGQEFLSKLNENCVIDSTVIRWGLDHFVRSQVSFIDILLQGDE